MKRTRVRDMMTTDVISVGPEVAYKAIVDLLESHHISAVPVVDEDNRVIGLVSEADLMRKVEFAGLVPEASIFSGKSRRQILEKADAITAADLMTRPPVTVGPIESVTAAARIMAHRRIKRLPVVDEQQRLVGIVSRADLLRVYLRDDDTIRTEIRDEILKRTLWMDPESLNLTVTDGVVTIAGTVDRRSSIRVVTRLVATVDGVVDLVSHLTYHFDDRKAMEGVPAGLY